MTVLILFWSGVKGDVCLQPEMTQKCPSCHGVFLDDFWFLGWTWRPFFCSLDLYFFCQFSGVVHPPHLHLWAPLPREPSYSYTSEKQTMLKALHQVFLSLAAWESFLVVPSQSSSPFLLIEMIAPFPEPYPGFSISLANTILSPFDIPLE